MVNEKDNILEYEEILLGIRQSFTRTFQSHNMNERKEAAGNIWRYAMTEIMHWTPKEALTLISKDVVNMLCLDRVLTSFGYNKKKEIHINYNEFLSYAFPDEIHYNLYDQVIMEYQKVAKIGLWSGDTSVRKLPKKFFSDENGYARAHIALKYVLDFYKSDETNIENLYDFFANKPAALKWLKEKNLSRAVSDCYCNEPLDYFHFSLPDKQKDNLCYYNHVLHNAYLIRRKESKKKEPI